MTAPAALTRKAGPLPVWASALALAAGFLVLRSRTASGLAATSTPVLPSQRSGAQQPASGQGSPADNGNSDLLDALGANSDAANALLAAVQASGGGYGSGTGGGGTTGGAASTAAVTAPTVDSGTNNAPADTFATTDNSSPQSQPAVVSGGQTNADLPADQQLAGVAANAYVIGGPSQVAPPVMFGSQPFGTFTTSPTVVQPAPVDTGLTAPARSTLTAIPV